MSRMQKNNRWVTCVPAALTKRIWLLQNTRRASATTTLGRDNPIDERKYKHAALAVKSLQAYSTVQGSTVQKRTAQHSTVQYSTVQYSTVQSSTVKYSAVQCRTAQYSTVQYSTVQYSTVQYSTVQYSTVQNRTEQNNTVTHGPMLRPHSAIHYSTVHYSMVQCSTVQYSTVVVLHLLELKCKMNVRHRDAGSSCDAIVHNLRPGPAVAPLGDSQAPPVHARNEASLGSRERYPHLARC